MEMKIRIVGVWPHYVDVGGAGDPVKQVMGSWDFDVVVVESDVTYEQACEALKDRTEFE